MNIKLSVMKSMYYLLLITFLVYLQTFGNTMFAQEPESSRFERIHAMKVGFITENLKLTPEEAEVFWPIYNDFQKKNEKINNDKKKTTHHFRINESTLSDTEIEAILDEYIQYQKQEIDLLIEYHEKFTKILPPKKVMKLYIAEIQFRGYLLDKIREHRGPGRK